MVEPMVEFPSTILIAPGNCYHGSQKQSPCILTFPIVKYLGNDSLIDPKWRLAFHIPFPLKGVSGDVHVVSERNVQRRREHREEKKNCPIPGISVIKDCFFLPLTPSELSC
jgi:hypothetical protein